MYNLTSFTSNTKIQRFHNISLLFRLNGGGAHCLQHSWPYIISCDIISHHIHISLARNFEPNPLFSPRRYPVLIPLTIAGVQALSCVNYYSMLLLSMTGIEPAV